MDTIGTESVDGLKETDAEQIVRLNILLSDALRALCLTRDYVGEDSLPAVKGWEWYDVGSDIAAHLDGSIWVDEFRKRVNIYKSLAVRREFKVGDWVFGIGKHVGCSPVFEGTLCDYQPFSYLDCFNPEEFRLATNKEIENATSDGI